MSARHLLSAAFASALLACTATPKAETTTATSRPASRPADLAQVALRKACQSTCEQRSMARAVSAEMIVADCKKRCEEVQGWPEVASGPGARRQVGGRVRVRGHYDGEAVVLEDGVRVRVDGAVPLPVGSSVVVAGRLDSAPEGFLLVAEYGAAVSDPRASG